MYNISITGVIVLSNEMIIDIILIRIWNEISSLNFFFKRGQGRLPYILLLLGNMSCHVIYQKSNQILKESIIYHDIHVNHFKKYQMWKKLRMCSHYFLDHPRTRLETFILYK